MHFIWTSASTESRLQERCHWHVVPVILPGNKWSAIPYHPSHILLTEIKPCKVFFQCPIPTHCQWEESKEFYNKLLLINTNISTKSIKSGQQSDKVLAKAYSSHHIRNNACKSQDRWYTEMAINVQSGRTSMRMIILAQWYDRTNVDAAEDNIQIININYH